MSRKHRNQASQVAQQAMAAAESPEPATEPRAEAPNRPLPAPRNDDRHNALDEILEARKEQLKAPEPTFEPDPNVAKDEPAPAEAPAKEVVAEAAPEAAPEPEPPKMVTLTVDGESIQVTQAEVDAEGGVAAAQIKRAADKRLKAAQEALAESRRTQAMMEQMLRQQVQAQQPAPKSAREVIAEMVPKIQYGTPEEATAALEQLLASQRVDPQQIQAQATQQAVFRVMQHNAAAQFKKEFGDLMADPMLARFIAIEENERLSKGIPQDFDQFYRTLGNDFRTKFGRQNQPATDATTEDGKTSQPSAKEARKASIVNLPTAGSRATVSEEPKPKTREEILNEAKKARGFQIG